MVTAAAGGVGMATVDLAANVLGAKVIGAAGGEAKNELVLQQGASNVIDYKTQDIREKVKWKILSVANCLPDCQSVFVQCYHRRKPNLTLLVSDNSHCSL